jgi:hypothetical protein
LGEYSVNCNFTGFYTANAAENSGTFGRGASTMRLDSAIAGRNPAGNHRDGLQRQKRRAKRWSHAQPHRHCLIRDAGFSR